MKEFIINCTKEYILIIYILIPAVIISLFFIKKILKIIKNMAFYLYKEATKDLSEEDN